MIAMPRYLMAGIAVALLAGCDLLGPGSPSIAGRYTLDQVDGLAPPCCADADSAGGTVMIVSGALVLGEAAPETYGFPPSGVPLANSCVHEIPNGAFVDTANVVHLPDGSSYRIPRCGDGPFTLVLTRRHVLADGTSGTVADTSAGLYTWGNAQGSDAETYITLVDAGMGGAVISRPPDGKLRVARQHVGPPNLWPHEHELLFVSGAE